MACLASQRCWSSCLISSGASTFGLFDDDLRQVVTEGVYKFVIRDGEFGGGFRAELADFGFLDDGEDVAESAGGIEVVGEGFPSFGEGAPTVVDVFVFVDRLEEGPSTELRASGQDFVGEFLEADEGALGGVEGVEGQLLEGGLASSWAASWAYSDSSAVLQ